ncbi:C-X-C chemokine receptor type 2-like isoform X3 [Paramisgurnus dabryanus]|uniref:C-X-C chemokine receptor type 2-like isoform X3 n=1 Tax=Paramisgurnus dabryanus TaxID=90735 RepID=UPI0031F3C1A1
MNEAAMNDSNNSLRIEDFSTFFYEDYNYTDYTNPTDYILEESTLICPLIPIADAVNISFCIIYVIIFLVAVPGNLLVGCVIGSNRRSLSSSDVYLFNLMLADTLLALILPFSAVSVVHGWVFGDFTCKLVSLVKEINFYTSILFLVCISVDRYMVIVRAMESQNARQRQCSCVACAVVWFFGGVLSLPSLYNEAYFSQIDEQTVCAERFKVDSADEWRLATRIMRHLLGFILPLVVMLTCYSVTVARLLRMRGFQNHRAMKVIVTVVVAFLLCWTPFHVTTMVDTLLRAKAVQFTCSMWTSMDVAVFATQNLGLVHCCVNPVLYALMGEKFRRQFMQLLQRQQVLDHFSISRPSRPLQSEVTSSFL